MNNLANLGPIGGFLPLIIVLVLMYFMMIRPQQKQQKQLSEMRSALTIGDSIVTIGGIKGTITKVGDDFITIKSGNGAQFDLLKTAIGQVVDKKTVVREEVKDETQKTVVRDETRDEN